MINTIEDLLIALPSKQSIQPVKYGAATSAIAGYWNSSWTFPGSSKAPTPPSGSGESCDRTTVGAFFFEPVGTGRSLYLSKFMFAPNQAIGAYLLDRLVHTSGLSGTVITPQTVNSALLPTRSGEGHGTELWVEFYVTTGATARTLTITYTNSMGVTGRTAVVTVPASCRQTCTIRAPLASGDRGVKSVQTVQLNATTGTAGNFGIVIAKRIATIDNAVAFSMVQLGPIELQLPIVDNDSCLYLITNAATTTSPSYDIELNLIEGAA